MMWRLGSLCTGYGGLDLAVATVYDVRHAWHAEIDPDASKVLAAHWPTVLNHGDLRTSDWSSTEPVDILTAGFPCQPFSVAGQRKGITDERWLFDDIADAVGRMVTRPRMLVLENVPGLLTANCGDAMARVVQGLAALGYVGRYRVVRAADVGAAHRRDRVFIVAHLADTDSHPVRQQPVPVPGRVGPAVAGGGGAGSGVLNLLPTPAARLGERWGRPNADTAHRRMYDEGRRNLEDAVALLPTPRATDGTKGGPNQRGSSGDLMLPSAVVQLLPTPTAMHDARNATSGRTAVKPTTNAAGWTLADVAHADRWGEYGPAIVRWEHVTGRTAPDPTELGTKGQPRLAPRFVEWLMGLPAGWVTDHLPRNPSLRVLGNGVVPQQAATALRLLGTVA